MDSSLASKILNIVDEFKEQIPDENYRQLCGILQDDHEKDKKQELYTLWLLLPKIFIHDDLGEHEEDEHNHEFHNKDHDIEYGISPSTIELTTFLSEPMAAYFLDVFNRTNRPDKPTVLPTINLTREFQGQNLRSICQNQYLGSTPSDISVSLRREAIVIGIWKAKTPVPSS